MGGRVPSSHDTQTNTQTRALPASLFALPWGLIRDKRGVQVHSGKNTPATLEWITLEGWRGGWWGGGGRGGEGGWLVKGVFFLKHSEVGTEKHLYSSLRLLLLVVLLFNYFNALFDFTMHVIFFL